MSCSQVSVNRHLEKMEAKIVVTGSLNGQFPAVFKKLGALHAKNTFSFALLLGDVFTSPSAPEIDNSEDIQRLLRGEIKVALPTYFTLGISPLPEAIQQRVDDNAGEVCENLFYLGKRGTLNTSEGCKIVALGGRLDANLTGASKEQRLPFYSEQDAVSLKGANYADLLVTQEWPKDVTEGSTVGKDVKVGTVQALARLADGLRPRYHFVAGGGTFFEREPYKNALREKDGEGASEIVTRFIAVADYGNAQKAKWMYAFNLNLKQPSIVVPPNTTKSPYTSTTKKRSHESTNFFWGDTSSHNDRHNNHRNGGKRQRQAPPGPESCFFCLSNPNLAKHLITSIGTDAYLTTAKGPLTTPTTNSPLLKFPGHVLIMPLVHTATLAGVEDDGATRLEMERYRKALEQMYERSGCGMVTWEVVRRAGIHTHWQVLPVRKDKMGDIERTFIKLSKLEEGAEEVQKREMEEEKDGDCFRVWIAGLPVENGDEEGDVDADAETDAKTTTKSLVVPLKEYPARFDLQFGRKVMAKVLNMPDRIHWKDCNQTVEEEMKDAEDFKKAFKEFDFSLEE